MSITINGATGIIADSPATVKANAFLDAAGGNTATINGKLPIAIGDVPAGVTLLGTIATTSGTSVTLSGLTLTSYKQLQFVFDGVSGTGVANAVVQLNSIFIGLADLGIATQTLTAGGIVDLSNGVFWSSARNSGQTSAGNASSGPSGLTTASTSITFTISSGSFDAGSIRIYGVK